MKLLGAMALSICCGINTPAQSSPATENSIPKISQSTNAPVAHVATEGKYGFIDKFGKYIIEPQFDLAGVKAGVKLLHHFNHGVHKVLLLLAHDLDREVARVFDEAVVREWHGVVPATNR